MDRQPRFFVAAVIPARVGSRRLPHKPLLELGGEPLVCRTWRRVVETGLFGKVVVATDDTSVATVAAAAGAEVCLVEEPCDSGTQRTAFAAARDELAAATHLVNVQCDEAFIDTATLRPVIDLLHTGASVVTAAAPLPARALTSHDQVKVVRDKLGRALYFSRAAIPGLLHLGVYGFSRGALERIARLHPGPLARAEDLEQLTWLESGWSIVVADVPRALVSVNTLEDLETARALLLGEERCIPALREALP